jgi:hypothetical protein
MSDQFGRRYVQQSAFIAYAKHLGLDDTFLDDRLEFAERCGIVTPAARVRFPDSVVRRWFQKRYPTEIVVQPIEPDGPLLDAANALHKHLAFEAMGRSELLGDHKHPLEVLAPEWQQFVSTDFDSSTFKPWDTFRTEQFIRNGKTLGGRDGVQTYYHAWQVFQLAAFLRSGLTVLYDISKDHTWDSLLDLRNRDDVRVSANIDAGRELKALKDNAALFDAVARFDDLSHRALQIHARSVNPQTMRLPPASWRALRARETEIAREIVSTSRLSAEKLIEFLQLLCGLWSEARDHYPAAVTDAYKRTISSTIQLLRFTNRRFTARKIIKQVGAVGGWHRPTLEVIFPDWVREQREVVELSLSQWIVPHLAQMPQDFAFAASDVAPFCDWMEKKGFLQFYWHFRRLTDIGRFDDDMARSAVTVEVIGLASLIEHVITRALEDRNPPPRRETLKDLPSKIVELIKAQHPALRLAFEANARLRKTTKHTLRQQLARVKRMRSVGPGTPVLKALLRLVLIRNTASHAGLSGFSRDEMQTLIESLLISALVVWMAR